MNCLDNECWFCEMSPAVINSPLRDLHVGAVITRIDWLRQEIWVAANGREIGPFRIENRGQ
jgi:hypothetical protein